MLHKAKQILEGTLADIRDEAKYRYNTATRKPANPNAGFVEKSINDLADGADKIGSNVRVDNLKRDAKTAAGAVALGVASYKAISLYKKRKLHNKWKSVGCDKLTDSVERAKCKQYIASIS